MQPTDFGHVAVWLLVVTVPCQGVLAIPVEVQQAGIEGRAGQPLHLLLHNCPKNQDGKIKAQVIGDPYKPLVKNWRYCKFYH